LLEFLGLKIEIILALFLRTLGNSSLSESYRFNFQKKIGKLIVIYQLVILNLLALGAE